MKKFFLVLVILCAMLFAGYAGASYWAGMQAQKHYELMISKLSRPGVVEVTKKSYDRGIFDSRAETAVTVKQPGGQRGFTVVNSIQHGPLALASNAHLKGPVQLVQALIWTRLSPGPENGDTSRNILEKIPELQSSELLTVLFFDGSGETYMDIPAFRKKLEDEKGDEVNVAWSGLNSKSNFDVGLGEVTGSFGAPSLEMWDKNIRFRLTDLAGDFNSHPGIKGLLVGSASVSAGDFEITDNDNTYLHLLSSGIRLESGDSAEAINSSLGLHFDALEVGGETLGPFDMDFEARKLDADALLRLQQFMAALPDKMAGKSDKDIGSILGTFSGPFLIELISKSPELELKQLKIKTSRGDLFGKAKLNFTASGPGFLVNPFALLNSIDARAEMSVSEPLFFFAVENIFQSENKDSANRKEVESQARQNAQMIADGLLSKKLMVRESGAFKSSAAYSFGKLTVNGRKVEASEPLTDLLPE